MTRQEILAIARPILFNTEMVRAILDNRKTATRRVMKPQPTAEAPTYCYADTYKKNIGCWHDKGGHRWKPPCHAGDYLYVRETWAFDTGDTVDDVGTGYFIYKADEQDSTLHHWRPSIHMPKEAARIFLRVTEVRVERLQEINGNGMEKEGIKTGTTHFKRPFNNFGNADQFQRAVKEFSSFWDRIIKTADLPIYGWEANSWVWVIEFERVIPEGAD